MTPRERTATTREGLSRGDRRSAARARRSLILLECEAERLSARIDQLEREKAALEAFAGLAAHELVEPLVITEAYATMVSERLIEAEHAESRRDLAALGRTVSRTRVLLEALLHDARSAHDHLPNGQVDLGALVAECLQLLSNEIEARGTHVWVGTLPSVSGNEALLNGLFANLLMNALKYSPRHGADIAVDATREGGVWRICVDSEGPTIPVR